jgi:hypothetical protein
MSYRTEEILKDTTFTPDIPKTVKNLKARNMDAVFLPGAAEALAWVKATLVVGSKVAIGGSNTLRDIGVTGYIEDGDFNYVNRYVKGQKFRLDPSIAPETVKRSYIEAFTADYYLLSANAITENGELVNVDGMGNRVAALAYGPKKVIVIAGRNKIVADLPAAFERLGKIIGQGGMGEQRGMSAPCLELDGCVDCRSDHRACCSYSITAFQRKREGEEPRISVLVIDEDVGF